MAQREMEETEIKVPETLTCVNNCGLSGNPATKNMCQSCFQATLAPTPPTCSAHEKPRSGCIRSLEATEAADLARPNQPSEAAEQAAPVRVVNRCSGCRKKVGLMGFRCRCGDLYCAEHRYSDRHVCCFDYKAAGREAIARENPVVKSAKMVRI